MQAHYSTVTSGTHSQQSVYDFSESDYTNDGGHHQILNTIGSGMSSEDEFFMQ
jgi:predicted heme/steroid binding protein